MRSPFSSSSDTKSKTSFFRRSSSSTTTSTLSEGTASARPTPRPAPRVDPDSFEKISVASDYSPPRSKYSSPQPPSTPTPAVVAAPRCRVCSKPCTLLVTRSSNRNGNAGRPYYKCIEDDVFACFADTRGDAENNPACHCGVSSRRQLSSAAKGRKIFYKCRSGTCDFFQFHQRADGSEWGVDEDVANALAELRVV